MKPDMAPKADISGPYGLIPPSMALQQKVGPEQLLDNAVLTQLEGALDHLETEMSGWLKHDLHRLILARDNFLTDNSAEEFVSALYRAAHDLKGLGATYGFPVVSVIADTLCKLLRSAGDAGTPPQHDLVNAHVDALRAVVNLDIRDHSNSPAAELVRSLHTITQKKPA